MVVMDVMDHQDHEVSLEGMEGMDRLDNWALEGNLALLGGFKDHIHETIHEISLYVHIDYTK